MIGTCLSHLCELLNFFRDHEQIASSGGRAAAAFSFRDSGTTRPPTHTHSRERAAKNLLYVINISTALSPQC